jgi:acylphosphatase
VEVVAEGEKGLVEELLASLRRGPQGAHVSGLDVRWVASRDEFNRFEIRF